MKNLITTINEGHSLEFVGDDYHKFHKDYEKFLELIEDEEVDDKIKKAIDQIKVWVEKEIDRNEGLPAAYHRYEQFTYALMSFDREAREGAGSLYDKDITDKLIGYWEKATGYKIKNQYK